MERDEVEADATWEESNARHVQRCAMGWTPDEDAEKRRNWCKVRYVLEGRRSTRLKCFPTRLVTWTLEMALAAGQLRQVSGQLSDYEGLDKSRTLAARHKNRSCCAALSTTNHAATPTSVLIICLKSPCAFHVGYITTIAWRPRDSLACDEVGPVGLPLARRQCIVNNRLKIANFPTKLESQYISHPSCSLYRKALPAPGSCQVRYTSRCFWPTSRNASTHLPPRFKRIMNSRPKPTVPASHPREILLRHTLRHVP